MNRSNDDSITDPDSLIHTRLQPPANEETVIGSDQAITDLASTQTYVAASGDAGVRRLLGRYEILGEIARGGMGVVYKAYDRQLDRTAAVKLIKSGEWANADELERFQVEAKAAARLDHPGIVPVFEVGESEGQHFLAMAFIDGESLMQRIKESPLGPQEAARLMQHVTEAMHYAHSRGIVHRDLKPQNILLTKEGQPKITDFGLAKRQDTDGSLTQTGLALGTPQYMPPEQAKGNLKQIGPLSDIYSLGATLYCLLTGRPPFQAATHWDTMLQVIEQEPVAPRQLNASIPRDLETICLKCLQKAPERRYPSAQELADDLRRFLDGVPIHARPVGLAERLWRWCHRNKALASFAATAGLLLAAVATVSTVAYFREANLVQEKDSLVQTQKTTIAEKDAYAKAAEREQRKAEELLSQKNTLVEQQKLIISEKEELMERESHARQEDEAKTASLYFRQGLRECEEGHFDSGLLNLQHAWRMTPADNPLRDSYRNVFLDRTFDGGNLTVPRMFCGDDISAVDFSPDGRFVVIASDQRYFPSAGPRAWARLWNARTGQPVGRPMEHEHRIASVLFDPAGEFVLTASWDGTARRWDAKTGEPIGQPLQHGQPIASAAFSPSGDRILTVGWGDVPESSRNLVAWSYNQRWLPGTGIPTGRLWDAQTSDALGEVMPHPEHVLRMAFSPDGDQVLTSCTDNAVRLWDARDGKPIGEPLLHPSIVLAIEYHPKGDRFLTGCNDSLLRIWNARDATPMIEPQNATVPIHYAVFSPRGDRIAVAGYGNEVWFHETETGKRIGEALKHPEQVMHIAWNPQGTRLATSCFDHKVRTWNVEKAALVREPATLESRFATLRYSPQGDQLLVVGRGEAARCTAQLWDVTETFTRPSRKETHWSNAKQSHDGQRLYVENGGTGYAYVWDAKTGKPVGVPVKLEFPTRLKEFSPSADRVFVVSFESGKNAAAQRDKGQMWDVATGQPVGKPFEESCHSARFMPDGKTILIGELKNRIRLWDVATGEPRSGPRELPDQAYRIAVTTDGARIACCCNVSGTIHVFDIRGSSPAFSLVPGPIFHHIFVSNLEFSPQGDHLLTVGGRPGAPSQPTVQFWNVPSGKSIGQLIPLESWPSNIVFSPQGDRVLICVSNGPAYLWDCAQAKRLGEPIRHGNGVLVAAFDPAGERVLTTDGTTPRLWDARTGAALGLASFPSRRISAVAFEDDGKQLALLYPERAAVLQNASPLPSPTDFESFIELVTFRTQDEQGNGAPLSHENWLALWDRLANHDSDWFEELQRRADMRIQNHHANGLAEAEVLADRFAEDFHRRWLTQPEHIVGSIPQDARAPGEAVAQTASVAEAGTIEDFETIRHASLDDLLAWLKTMSDRKFLPTYVGHRNTSSGTRFDAIAVLGSERPEFVIRSGLSEIEGESVFQELRKDHRRMIHVIDSSGDESRQFQTWVRGSKLGWASWVGTESFILERLKSARAAGQRPTHLCVAPAGERTGFACDLIDDNVLPWEVQFDVSAEKLALLAEEQRRRGWRINLLYARYGDNSPGYAVGLVKNSPVIEWLVDQDVPDQAVSEKMALMKARGFCPVSLATTGNDGFSKTTIVWVRFRSSTTDSPSVRD